MSTHPSSCGGALLAPIVLALLATPAAAQSSFDGTWSGTRAMSRECSIKGANFKFTVRNGTVTAPGGRGTVTASGAIQFPGFTNTFTGTLQGNSGSGIYTGKCSGTWSATRG